MDPRLAPFVDRIPGWDAAKARIEPLPGGLTNSSFMVAVGEDRFVLRLGGRGATDLGVDRRREGEIAEWAAAADLGPEVVCVDPDADLLIARLAPGEVLAEDSAREPGRLVRIAAAVRRLHGAEPFGGTFSPFEMAARTCALARERQVAAPEGLDRALDLLARMGERLWPPPVPAPCHNDVVAANLVDDGQTVRLLDWEYAATGDPVFDLANFAAKQDFVDDETEAWLGAYFEGAPPPGAMPRLRLLRLVSDMVEVGWGLVRASAADLDFDFANYARAHLARFLAYAAPGALERDLDAVLAAEVHP